MAPASPEDSDTDATHSPSVNMEIMQKSFEQLHLESEYTVMINSFDAYMVLPFFISIFHLYKY